MLKYWLLFVFDLGAVACAVRAGLLTYAAMRTRPDTQNSDRAWVISEAAGWTAAGCVAAFAAFLVVIIPA
ncbi:hypothetical protein [uncultured Methylovirgula sp.]|uniref:hypothetical protein n=1 Tax=uncultured Methylovirgula sp. TaxID=1285960 RepID=UPI00261B7AFE|nr:hypothetical protein [uncultured Methylovirgula sp.]